MFSIEIYNERDTLVRGCKKIMETGEKDQKIMETG